jgi:hypothetical protein
MFRAHYDSWRASRMRGTLKYIPDTYFKSKTLLELGCGHADIGHMFSELGAIVTSSDARTQHIETVKRKYPHLKTALIDCENTVIPEKYDIILHWGVLYHLSQIEDNLAKVSDKCDVLLLETEVCDSDEKDFYLSVNESGYDQAFHSRGIRPSPTYVESLLSKGGFQFKMIQDPILNSDYHTYDWEITNSKIRRNGLRRFWICWKNVECPIVI